jgi:hypothetical protein
LDANQVQELLERRWTPAGVTLPDEKVIPEVIASLMKGQLITLVVIPKPVERFC